MFFIYPKHAFGVHGPLILILTWKWRLPFGAVQYQHPNTLPACGKFQSRWEAGPHLEGRQLGEGLYFSGVSQCLKPRTLNLFREWCKAQGQPKVICCTDSQEPKACWVGPYRGGAVGTVLSRLFLRRSCLAFTFILSTFLNMVPQHLHQCCELADTLLIYSFFIEHCQCYFGISGNEAPYNI